MERIIKRYQNRKMYDTVEKRYIKLDDIQTMIRDNIELKIIDNVTGNDITRQILVQLVMRSEQGQTERRLPLEGLRDMIQNEDGPVFQAFRGMVNFGKGMASQMGFNTDTDSNDKSEESGAGQLGTLTELLKKSVDKVSDATVKVVDGTLARELLKVPNKDDWNRLQKKFDDLEKKLSELNDKEGDVK